MIYTTYYANLRNIPESVRVFAISNCTPSGIFIPHIHELAPLWSEVEAYKKSGDFEAFKKGYLQKLESAHVDEMVTTFSFGDVALVCYEKDHTQCHRSILAEYIREHYNVGVREWGCRDDTT